jgi:hypothetical protein
MLLWDSQSATPRSVVAVAHTDRACVGHGKQASRLLLVVCTLLLTLSSSQNAAVLRVASGLPFSPGAQGRMRVTLRAAGTS